MVSISLIFKIAASNSYLPSRFSRLREAEQFLLKCEIPVRIDNRNFVRLAPNDQKCLGQKLSKIDGSHDKSQLFQST